MSTELVGGVYTNSDGMTILPDGDYTAHITNARDEGVLILFDITIEGGPEIGISSHTLFSRGAQVGKHLFPYDADELDGRDCLLTIKQRISENGDRYEELENFKVKETSIKGDDLK